MQQMLSFLFSNNRLEVIMITCRKNAIFVICILELKDLERSAHLEWIHTWQNFTQWTIHSKMSNMWKCMHISQGFQPLHCKGRKLHQNMRQICSWRKIMCIHLSRSYTGLEKLGCILQKQLHIQGRRWAHFQLYVHHAHS